MKGCKGGRLKPAISLLVFEGWGTPWLPIIQVN